MAKSVAKKLDEQMATELNLELSDYTAMLHHAVTLHDKVEGFIFAFVKNDQVYYDRVDAWTEVNGQRLRIARFKSNPVVEDRLVKRMYNRWYVWGNGVLVPVNITKVDDLKDNFYFLIDDDPRHCTYGLSPEETQFIRKKPLKIVSNPHPGWGVVLHRKIKHVCAA